MLALVLDGTARLVPDHPPPERRAGEALVRVRLAGVCDTDLQLARGYLDFRGVPGHEFVGEVLAADAPTWIGRRVVADINAGCGACPDCLTARGHHCPARSVLGIRGRGGAFAELLSVPERCLVALPDRLDDARAVFAEPLAAALHVLDALGPDAPARALVLGDGKLGLLIALALARSGLDVALIGRHPHKLALARAAGVETFLEGQLPPARAAAPLVVEATGSEAGLARAIDLTAPRGTLVLKTTVAAPLTLDLAPIVVHELRLVGSRCGDLARAIEVLARGDLDPRPLIEARYPLARADEALVHAGRRGALKILLEP